VVSPVARCSTADGEKLPFYRLLLRLATFFTRQQGLSDIRRQGGRVVAAWVNFVAHASGDCYDCCEFDHKPAPLPAPNPARANDVFWSVGVASPGVRVVVGNAPQVVHPQVVYPQVVHPQAVYPQVAYPQHVVVVPQPVVLPHGHARPVVVMPQSVVYNRGPHGHFVQRHRGHGYAHGYGHVQTHGGWQGSGRSDGKPYGNAQGNGPRQSPGQGPSGGHDGRDGRDGQRR
jgi:hypothetical protein